VKIKLVLAVAVGALTTVVVVGAGVAAALVRALVDGLNEDWESGPAEDPDPFGDYPAWVLPVEAEPVTTFTFGTPEPSLGLESGW
jgi:hypothetical protein